jgi:hypothetical protein
MKAFPLSQPELTGIAFKETLRSVISYVQINNESFIFDVQSLFATLDARDVKMTSESELEQGVIIQFLLMNGRTADKTRTRLLPLYREAICSPARIDRWIREFWIGRTPIFDELCFNRPRVVECISPGLTFNSKDFCDVIALTSHDNTTSKTIRLSERQCESPCFRNDHRISLHQKFTRVPRPPYSPDIAPIDFYLFGSIKQCLPGCQARSFEGLQGNCQ